MAGIIASRSSKTLDDVKILVMKDLAVQQQLLDVVSVPLQRRIMERSQKQKLRDRRLNELSISEKKLKSWSLIFDELKAYKQSHEHCNVSKKENASLCKCLFEIVCYLDHTRNLTFI